MTCSRAVLDHHIRHAMQTKETSMYSMPAAADGRVELAHAQAEMCSANGASGLATWIDEEEKDPLKEHIYAGLTNGKTEEVWGILDPDKHSFACLATMVRELIVKKRGSLPHDVN